MKKKQLAIIAIYCALLYAQFYAVYALYFEFTNPDKIGLAISLVIPYILAQRFINTNNSGFLYLSLGFLMVLPLVVHPFISWTTGWFDYAWIGLHFLIATGGLAVAIIRDHKWVVGPFFSILVAWFLPFEYDKAQTKYYDKVIASIETRKGSGQIVQWKRDYWFYYNGDLYTSTIDDHVLKEAFVQPVMHLGNDIKEVLIIGDDEGLLSDELLKFPLVDRIVHLPYDLEYQEFIQNYSGITDAVADHHKVDVVDVYPPSVLADTTSKFDLIMISLTGASKIEYQQFHTAEFYQLCFNKLSKKGKLVAGVAKTYSRFGEIMKAEQKMQDAGFAHLAYHSQIPSIGQYAWIIGSKSSSSSAMTALLRCANPKVETTWWNREAMEMMLSFGKTSYFSLLSTETNRN